MQRGPGTDSKTAPPLGPVYQASELELHCLKLEGGFFFGFLGVWGFGGFGFTLDAGPLLKSQETPTARAGQLSHPALRTSVAASRPSIASPVVAFRIPPRSKLSWPEPV